jgi:hypothetical protein
VSTAAIVPAKAAPRNAVANAKMFATSPGATIRVGNRCWKQTDAGRGYGFWTACDNAVSYARAASEYSTSETYTAAPEAVMTAVTATNNAKSPAKGKAPAKRRGFSRSTMCRCLPAPSGC